MQMKPGRQLLTRSPHRRVGLISCPWFQQKQIQYESLLEKSFVWIALLCPSVTAIDSQPFTLEFSNGLKYTPDYLLSCWNCEQLLIEVKPRVFVEQHRERLMRAKSALEEYGYTFLICTDLEIRSSRRDKKASEILRYARSTDYEEHVAILRSEIAQTAFPQSIEALSSRLGLARHQVMGLIGRRELFLRPDLGLDSIFRLEAYKESENGTVSPGSWLGHSKW